MQRYSKTISEPQTPQVKEAKQHMSIFFLLAMGTGKTLGPSYVRGIAFVRGIALGKLPKPFPPIPLNFAGL
jgi:hypothetical protein